ncbi:MAG: methyltransferase [Anaerolineae bacterium]|nr:methyltransferase [Phycisphaerae bacterium]
MIPTAARPAALTAAEPTSERILQTGFGFWAAKALLSAVELGVFTELAAGPMEGHVLAARLGVHRRAANDFFDSLVALKFLNRDDLGRYSNSEDASQFLDRRKNSYIGGVLEMANAHLFEHWNGLTDALRTGRPQNEAKGQDAAGRGDHFAAIYRTPERLKCFLQAMTGISLNAGRVMAEKFPWAKHKTVLDIGTAEGGLPVQLLLAHGHLSGIGFDLPEVKPVFHDYIAKMNLADRLTFVGGDAFKDQLPDADVIVLGHMLHGWGAAGKRLLLERAFRALPLGGACIVYDAMIDDDRRENVFGLLMSLNMLIETDDGFDYTPAQCNQWLADAGFREIRTEHLTGPDSMCVGVKL